MTSPALESATSSVPCSELRTGVWYGDDQFTLRLPPEWHLVVQRPRTPPPLNDARIVESLEHPNGQAPIRELCRGRSRPLVIVDDLTRPTPVHRVMPFLLRQFQEAGIPAKAVRILVATGTHAAPNRVLAAKKVGPAAAAECQILVHTPEGQLWEIGKTSFGTPVTVNHQVVSSDCVVGVGGIYPNHTAGFGGGANLALGVLGSHSIRHLLYSHPSAGWGCLAAGHSFRQDLNEIARLINLHTVISVHINELREVIRLSCGDPVLFWDAEVEFARKTFAAPSPGGADVVISNAYPSDLSLTSAHMKGIAPLERCAAGASRILVASCPEGIGHRGPTPLTGHPNFYRLCQLAGRLAGMDAQDLFRKSLQRLRQPPKSGNPIWLYRPIRYRANLPSHAEGLRLTYSWAEILRAVKSEHPGKHYLNAVVYACAPLQCLIDPGLP